MNTRMQNKEKRRQRILFEARRVLTREGYDALTTRGLAKAAGVTQPTLYNLIGSKDDILRVLLEESVARVWERLNQLEASDPLEAIEAVTIEPLKLFEADETYHRAAVISSDHLHGALATGDDIEEQNFVGRESAQMATLAAQSAIDAGLLRGRIPASVFGEQMYICFRGPMRDWAYGFISLEEFRARALRGFYMTLAIDATPAFKTVLERKTVALLKGDQSSTPIKSTKQARRET
ncbi:MAG: TetR/AcrR family transcriptional regulator [Pseudomonadota bacterium]